MTTLSELIKQVGYKDFAKAIGKSEHTARAYRFGVRIPPGKVANRILSVYAGEITYAGIYGRPE
jgi:hypothetical protein